jgi:thioredoxin-dependent peroxiredoxin
MASERKTFMLRQGFLSCMFLIFAGFVFCAPAGVPEIGTQAPRFSLKNQDGIEIKLSDFKTKWVILYFYPKDFTSGCTVEAHNFQRDIDKYENLGAVIIGVSVDNVGSHKDFCAKEGLSFKLLADTEHTVSALYGSLGEYQGNAIALRNTFIIDPNGTIAKVYQSVKPANHSDEVLAALAQLQHR